MGFSEWTYARQNKHSLHDDEPPPKRRRVDATIEAVKEESPESATTPIPTISSDPLVSSSSPAESPAIYSDEPLKSTPPSSPLLPKSSPPVRTRRPMFSFFKRQQQKRPSAAGPLAERSNNVFQPPNRPTKQKNLVQMQLDLVSDIRKTCEVCGMQYVPSNTEDAALHRKYHAMNAGGVDFTKAVVEKLKRNQVWAGGDGSFVAVIGRKDTLALRNKASDLLKVVNTELAAVPILDVQLWSQIRTSVLASATSLLEKVQTAAKGKHPCSTSDRYKAYLYIRGQKCVGACLAERIQEAYEVVDQDDASKRSEQAPAESQSSSISIGTVPKPAILGISRIWTSNLHRKHGIATRLLDSARSDFLYGMTVEKDKVAFSQPTESGGKLARKWFERRAGWLVYMD
ncbi:hypothetical protein K491DRAFT_703021 [Lophiostoma macrostomum CBS 122681]|uniref:Sister chromatid cohesion acetyltransferas-like protein Eco1 n=1 Tax=Lophiostoma macrostomum CBS 122681 TaxID=1314788 RepID=A0A6A6TFN0_9PLEO|nr:hypothetical protein K491DRAFT_703021 [Lophiostoma macrostomum CBS 122681]